MRRLALALIVASLAACDAGFEDPSIVLDLRLLAMTASPPEVVFDFDPAAPAVGPLRPVDVSVLVADPGANRRLAWSMRACEPSSGDRCDGSEVIVPMGEGVWGDPEDTGSLGVRGTLVADASLLMASLASDPRLGFSGIEVLAEVRVWPEGDDPATAVVGLKSLVYAPRIPAERVANRNPTLSELTIAEVRDLVEPAPVTFDGARCGVGEPRPIGAGDRVRIEPLEFEGAREIYVLPTLDGGSRTITENLRYSWFATSGSFSSGQTGGETDAFGNVPVVWTEYVAPVEPGLVRLWMVVRDERGGTGSTERCLRVE